uniref:Leukocyte common antigen n=1 Tax=Magallana gigas TaxID=29159 RepID=K1R799_MAGGI
MSEIRCKVSEKESNRKEFEDDNDDENNEEGNSHEDLHINGERLIPDIAVDNLGEIIQEYSANDDDGFKKEYEVFGQENVYIATQGPRKNTVEEFWLMVWQENVSQIVMLTKVTEGKKAKCVQYWPDLEEHFNCDVFTISTTHQRQYANYVIRKMKIWHTKRNESRSITQYQYTSWPDHGVPDPLNLLLFKNHVTRSKCVTHGGPTLVHCSAGIGRTGTYIAIDALLREGQRNSKINIAECVKKIRGNRMNMVQTYIGNKTYSIKWAEPLFNLTPVNSQTVSQILSLVFFARNVDSERPITIISRDGAALCGVFCAVYNLVQQLTMDEEIDVFSVVRLLQTRRPELCDSLDEYKMIHDALFRFIKSRTNEHNYCNQQI